MKEIRIDLLPLIRKLEAVLKKGFSREIMAGNYQAVFKGKGLEFVGFREYAPSDDALIIDWKASLKANKLMVKELQEERDLTIFFMFDVSDSMLLSSHAKLKCEYAAEMIGTLSFAMHSVGDNVGICFFTDKIVKLILPARGRDQFYKIVKALGDPSNYGGKFDFNFAMRYALSLSFLRKDSVIFIVSDFIGLKPGWEDSIKLLGLKFDLTAIVVRDPIDIELPAVDGEINLGDPFSKEQMLINPIEGRRTYELEANKQISRLKEELNKSNSSMIVLRTDKEFTHDIFGFFKMRQRYK